MRRRTFLAGAGGVTILAEIARGSCNLQESSNRRQDPAALVVDGSDVSLMSEGYLDLLKAAGVDVWHNNRAESLVEISQIYNFLDAHSGKVSLVRSVGEIEKAKRADKLALILGWQDAYPLSGESGNDWLTGVPQLSLRAYYELGIRIINLAYNLGNQFAGGCLDPTMPLTRSGEFLVRKMQEMGILVDCGGHTGERSSLDIIRIAKRPIICSHSNVRALNDNPRCTSDRVIEGIARTGGVFGVCAVDAFMTWGYQQAKKDPIPDIPAQAQLGRYVDEIDYLMRLVGPEHIGLGPDFTEGEPNFSLDPADAFGFPSEMTYKLTGQIRYVGGFERISQLGNVHLELQKRGYSAENIQKIMGDNWMRVYRQGWDS